MDNVRLPDLLPMHSSIADKSSHCLQLSEGTLLYPVCNKFSFLYRELIAIHVKLLPLQTTNQSLAPPLSTLPQCTSPHLSSCWRRGRTGFPFSWSRTLIRQGTANIGPKLKPILKLPQSLLILAGLLQNRACCCVFHPRIQEQKHTASSTGSPQPSRQS